MSMRKALSQLPPQRRIIDKFVNTKQKFSPLARYCGKRGVGEGLAAAPGTLLLDRVGSRPSPVPLLSPLRRGGGDTRQSSLIAAHLATIRPMLVGPPGSISGRL